MKKKLLTLLAAGLIALGAGVVVQQHSAPEAKAYSVVYLQYSSLDQCQDPYYAAYWNWNDSAQHCALLTENIPPATYYLAIYAECKYLTPYGNYVYGSLVRSTVISYGALVWEVNLQGGIPGGLPNC